MFSKILRTVRNATESLIEIGKSVIDIIDGVSKITRIWSRIARLA